MSDLEYVEPNSLEDVFANLDPDDPAIRPIAGGTALMLMMKAGFFRPVRLVSLRQIARSPNSFDRAPTASFRIGALTPLAELEHSPEMRRHVPVVSRR